MNYQTQVRPWCVMRQVSEVHQEVVERFRHYQDADARAKVLCRQVANESFVVFFSPGSLTIPESSS